MKQTALPGMEVVESARDARRRRRRVRKIIDATREGIRGLNIGLEMLERLSRELVGAQCEMRSQLHPADELKNKKHQFSVIEFPNPKPIDWREIVLDFADECLAPDPTGSLDATTIYQAFVAWFALRHPEIHPRPSQRRLGQHLGRLLRREKHGIYLYYGIRLMDGEGP